MVSPKHRLIKVDSQEFGRCKVPLSPVTVQEDPVRTAFICILFFFLLHFSPIPSILCFVLMSLAYSFSHKNHTQSYISNILIRQMLFVSFSLPTQVVPSAPAATDADTDYSDPFDVRPDPRGRSHWEPKPAPTDCCSYMEPFEAQRIISGLL